MTPTVTIAVTGLSGSGKTVVLTSAIHRLLDWNREEMRQFPKRPLAYPVKAEVLSGPETGRLGRLPFAGRLQGRRLIRFPYEEHFNCLKQSPPHWPESTTELSECRLRVSFRRTSMRDKQQQPHGKWHDLNVILIDYPGEWFLDIPLLKKDFRLWLAEEIARAREPHRARFSCKWLSPQDKCHSSGPCSPSTAGDLVEAYRAYIKTCSWADAGIVHIQPGFFLDSPPEQTFLRADVQIFLLDVSESCSRGRARTANTGRRCTGFSRDSTITADGLVLESEYAVPSSLRRKPITRPTSGTVRGSIATGPALRGRSGYGNGHWRTRPTPERPSWLSTTWVLAVMGGVLGKVAAQAAQGMTTGIMTIRVGIATWDNCRPLPLNREEKHGVVALAFEEMRKPLLERIRFGDAKGDAGEKEPEKGGVVS